MVGPTKRSLFRFVFKFCFHYSIIWFFSVSYENWKHILGVFKLWKQNYDNIFVNTHIEGPTVRPFALSNTVVFFFFFFFLLYFFWSFTLGLDHFYLFFSSFLSFSCWFLGLVAFFFFPFHIGFLGLDVATPIKSNISLWVEKYKTWLHIPTSYLHLKMQHDLHALEQILTFNLTLTPSNLYQVKPTSIQSISTFNLTSKSIIPLRKSKIQNLKSIIENKK